MICRDSRVYGARAVVGRDNDYDKSMPAHASEDVVNEGFVSWHIDKSLTWLHLPPTLGGAQIDGQIRCRPVRVEAMGARGTRRRDPSAVG